MSSRVFLILALGLAAGATSAGAELVVFSNGGHLEVESYEVDGGKVRLGLASGGTMKVALKLIERIVDNEVVRPEELAAEDEVEPAPIELGFLDSHQVPESPYGELIFDAAKQHGVNPELVAAMVRAESAFDPHAVSVKGARGLMQLMPATARRFGVAKRDLFKPAANLNAGLSYVTWLRKRFSDDLPRVLAAYNAGEGNVDRYGGVPPFRETREYIRRIYSFLGREPEAGAL